MFFLASSLFEIPETDDERSETQDSQRTSHNSMTKKNNRGEDKRSLSGWMQIVLPDVPADVLFDELRNMKTFVAAVGDVQSLERYDPATTIKNKKQRGKHQRHVQRPLPRRRQTTGDSDLAQAGDCFLQRRIFGGRPCVIHSHFTQVDDAFDPATGKRTIITNCSFMDSIITSTHVIERLSEMGPDNPTNGTDKPLSSTSSVTQESSSASDGSARCHGDGVAGRNANNKNISDDVSADVGCRWTLTYAMVPDGWYGRYLFWRIGKKRLARDLSQAACREFHDLHTHVRSRHGVINTEEKPTRCEKNRVGCGDDGN